LVRLAGWHHGKPVAKLEIHDQDKEMEGNLPVRQGAFPSLPVIRGRGRIMIMIIMISIKIRINRTKEILIKIIIRTRVSVREVEKMLRDREVESSKLRGDLEG